MSYAEGRAFCLILPIAKGLSGSISDYTSELAEAACFGFAEGVDSQLTVGLTWPQGLMRENRG